MSNAAILKQKKSKERRTLAIFTGPALIGLMVFLVIPFIMAVSLTFTNQKLISPHGAQYVGLENYKELLSVKLLTQSPERDPETQSIKLDEAGKIIFPRVRDITRNSPKYEGYRPLTEFTIAQKRTVIVAKDPIFIQSIWNTLLFAILVVPIQCGMALMLALLVNAGLKGQNLFRTIYFSPVIMSMVVVAVVWNFLYQKDFGLLNSALHWVSFGRIEAIDWLGSPKTAMFSIVLMSAWQGAGFQMLIFLAGLQGINKTLYDAAKIDGANAVQRFWNVTVPGLKNTTAFVIIVTTIMAFGLFTQVDVLTQGGPENSTSTVMFHAIERGVREQDISYGATITVIYFIIIATISVLQQRYLSRGDS